MILRRWLVGLACSLKSSSQVTNIINHQKQGVPSSSRPLGSLLTTYRQYGVASNSCTLYGLVLNSHRQYGLLSTCHRQYGVLLDLYRQYGVLSTASFLRCDGCGHRNSRFGVRKLRPGSGEYGVKLVDNSGAYEQVSWCSTSSSNHDQLPADVISALSHHKDTIAMKDVHGEHTYSVLFNRSLDVCFKILRSNRLLTRNLKEARVAFLCPNDVSYAVTLWGIWMAGGIAVPLSKTHPAPELEYFIQDSESSIVVTTQELESKIKPVAEKNSVPCITLEPEDFLGVKKSKRKERKFALEKLLPRRALIIYTSGTTGRPKGVVHTFGSLQSQVLGMIEAWGWTRNDCVLHVLPLHHVHGIVNVLMTPLFCGATCYMLPEFNARTVWECLMESRLIGSKRLNVFMAVPTIYAKLIQEHEEMMYLPFLLDAKYAVCSSCIRLMVSGSAALPISIMEKWKKITGHQLLERYGMTEIGMALTNPLHGDRIPGAVGTPFPGVEARIVRMDAYNADQYEVLVEGSQVLGTGKPSGGPSSTGKPNLGFEDDGIQGDLQIKGSSLFKEYWNKPEATAKEFTQDGWFKTGDTASFNNGVYKIMGRTSIDIIKSGGYKISSLDVERHLLEHPEITDVAVLGIPDFTWGQKVGAVIVIEPGSELDMKALKAWAQEKMPSYQIPSLVEFVSKMPRNAMGKVNKKDLLQKVFGPRLNAIGIKLKQ